jgi:hypothetical protein
MLWHTYVPLLGCFGDVHQINMSNEDSHDVNIEQKGDGALNIHEVAHVITYLQIGEIFIGLTPKAHDWVMHKAKQFK